MRRSRYEIASLVTRAAIGVGLPPGTAEEVARAALWLSGRGGGDGAAIMLEAMERIDRDGTGSGTGLGTASITRTREGWRLTGGSSAVAAISAADLLLAEPGVPVTLADWDRPMLLAGILGQALAASSADDATVTMVFADGGVARVLCDRLYWTGSPDGPGPCTLKLQRGVSVVPESDGPDAAVMPSQETLARLARLAARTLVPTDAGSRASGAGAGDIDNE